MTVLFSDIVAPQLISEQLEETGYWVAFVSLSLDDRKVSERSCDSDSLFDGSGQFLHGWICANFMVDIHLKCSP